MYLLRKEVKANEYKRKGEEMYPPVCASQTGFHPPERTRPVSGSGDEVCPLSTWSWVPNSAEQFRPEAVHLRGNAVAEPGR